MRSPSIPTCGDAGVAARAGGVVDEKLAEEAARLTGERYGELMPTESERLAAREQCTAVARKAIEGYMELYIDRHGVPSIMDDTLAFAVAGTVAEEFERQPGGAAGEDGEGGQPDDFCPSNSAYMGIAYYTDLWRRRGGGKGRGEIDEKLAEEAASFTGEYELEFVENENDRSAVRIWATRAARRGIELYMQAYIGQAAARQPQV